MTIVFDLRCGVSGDMLLSALLQMYSEEGDIDGFLQILERSSSVMSPTRIRTDEVLRGGSKALSLETEWDTLEDNGISGTRMMSYLDEGLSRIGANDRIRKKAMRMLQNILESEMTVHGERSIEDVHLHETGTPDTLIDIIGISSLYDLMEMDGEWIRATPISLGYGTVDTSHGVLQVPVPAVRHMIRSLPARSGPVEGELATPTGVSAASALVEIWMDHSEVGDNGTFKGRIVGRGAGKREYQNFTNTLEIWEVGS